MDTQTAILIVIGVSLVFGIIPFVLNKNFIKKYGESAFLSFPMLLQAVGTVACVYFSSDLKSAAFIAAVIITVIIYIISFCASFIKAATLDANTKDCVIAGIVQVLIPIGFAIIILCFITDGNGKKKRKRRK